MTVVQQHNDVLAQRLRRMARKFADADEPVEAVHMRGRMEGLAAAIAMVAGTDLDRELNSIDPQRKWLDA